MMEEAAGEWSIHEIISILLWSKIEPSKSIHFNFNVLFLLTSFHANVIDSIGLNFNRYDQPLSIRSKPSFQKWKF